MLSAYVMRMSDMVRDSVKVISAGLADIENVKRGRAEGIRRDVADTTAIGRTMVTRAGTYPREILIKTLLCLLDLDARRSVICSRPV